VIDRSEIIDDIKAAGGAAAGGAGWVGSATAYGSRAADLGPACRPGGALRDNRKIGRGMGRYTEVLVISRHIRPFAALAWRDAKEFEEVTTGAARGIRAACLTLYGGRDDLSCSAAAGWISAHNFVAHRPPLKDVRCRYVAGLDPHATERVVAASPALQVRGPAAVHWSEVRHQVVSPATSIRRPCES